MDNFTIMCKRFPAAPLVPCKAAGGEPYRFATREEAQAEVDSINKLLSRGMPGGGPSYFVVPVQSRSSK